MFRFSTDRQLYLAAHIHLRQTLSQHADVKPADWLFKRNAFGKPFIANTGYEKINFNLTHTKGMIACVVSYGTPVGIDAEKQQAVKDVDSLCRYTLSPLEASDVLAVQHADGKAKRFLTYWTLKEAYVKAMGQGLSIPLHQFTLRRNAQLDWSLYEPAIVTQQQQWQFKTQFTGTHHIAICARKINPSPLVFIFQ